MQRELGEILDKAAAEPMAGARPQRLALHTVATGRRDAFDRAEFYGDDER